MNDKMSQPAPEDQIPVEAGRRNLLKALGSTSLVAVTMGTLPKEWAKPVLNVGMLPAHAQTSVLVLPPTAPSICPPTPADIMLTVDMSGSIADDINASRDALLAFVNSRNLANDRIGLVSFDTAPLQFLALTQDKAALTNAISGLATRDGLTSIAVGIDRATNELKSGNVSGNQKILLLLSDGGANDPSRFTPRQGDPIGFPEARDAANNAKAAGIRVITIAIGSQDIVVTQADLDMVVGLMREMASSSSDFYFVENLDQLIRALTACS